MTSWRSPEAKASNATPLGNGDVRETFANKIKTRAGKTSASAEVLAVEPFPKRTKCYFSLGSFCSSYAFTSTNALRCTMCVCKWKSARCLQGSIKLCQLRSTQNSNRKHDSQLMWYCLSLRISKYWAAISVFCSGARPFPCPDKKGGRSLTGTLSQKITRIWTN